MGATARRYGEAAVAPPQSWAAGGRAVGGV
jgi:hypothetical protein